MSCLLGLSDIQYYNLIYRAGFTVRYSRLLPIDRRGKHTQCHNVLDQVRPSKLKIFSLKKGMLLVP